MINKYKKLPVVIEAIQLNKDTVKDVFKFMGIKYSDNLVGNNNSIYIHTLEGIMTASDSDFIIKGINGEFYPCKEDIFWKTYEKV